VTPLTGSSTNRFCVSINNGFSLPYGAAPGKRESLAQFLDALAAHIWPTYRCLPATTGGNIGSGIILRSDHFRCRQLPRVGLR
jgi:hypothetical protein